MMPFNMHLIEVMVLFAQMIIKHIQKTIKKNSKIPCSRFTRRKISSKDAELYFQGAYKHYLDL